MLLIAVLLFIVITVSITAFGYVHYVKPTRMLDQLASTTSDAIPGLASERQGQSELSLAELLAPIGNLLPISPQDTAITRGDLISAGFRSAQAVAVYYGFSTPSRRCSAEASAIVCPLLSWGGW